jgi:hypothetical protein
VGELIRPIWTDRPPRRPLACANATRSPSAQSERINPSDGSAKKARGTSSPGDLWRLPTGIPHPIRGLNSDGRQFLLVFNDGKFSEDNTTLLTEWTIHAPREVFGKNYACSSLIESRLTAVKTCR